MTDGQNSQKGSSLCRNGQKYVASLITNIDNRFKASLPVLKAFAIFDVLAIPSAWSPGFKEYGDRDINILIKHFFPQNGVEESDEANVNAEKLKAEWGKFKFDLIEWRADLPREIKLRWEVWNHYHNLDSSPWAWQANPHSLASFLCSPLKLSTVCPFPFPTPGQREVQVLLRSIKLGCATGWKMTCCNPFFRFQ